MLRISARKDVIEAVAIAALTTLCTGLITWAIEHYKDKLKKKKTSKKIKKK